MRRGKENSLTNEAKGWAWFAPMEQEETAALEGVPQDVARAAAKCFGEGNGAQVLAYLREITVERRPAPEASDALLRHLEGQRFIVACIDKLIRRGREGP